MNQRLRAFFPKAWKWKWLSGLGALGIEGVLFYLQNVDFTLHRFTDRAMGAAIASGVDPKLREPVYYLSFILFIGMGYGLWWILSKVKENPDFDQLWFQLGLMDLFSLVFRFKNFFVGVDLSLVHFDSFSFQSFALALLVFSLISALFQSVLSYKLTIEEQFVTILIPFSIAVTVFILQGRMTFELLSFESLGIELSAFVILLSLFGLMKKHQTRFLNASAWLLVSLSIPMLYREFPQLNPLYMLGFLGFAFSVTLGIPAQKSKLTSIHYPLILYIFFILTYGGQTLNLTDLDYLHLGNRVVPAQQFLQFFSIPLVDYWGAQHFNIGSVLYGLVHGLNGLNFLVWKDLDILLYAWMFYAIFKDVLGNTFTLLLILFLPMLGVVWGDQFGLVNTYYFGALLPLIYLKRYHHNPSLINASILTMLSLITFVWMPSMGKISILSTLALILVVSFKNKRVVSNLIGWSLAILFTGLIYFGLVMYRGHSLTEQLILIKAFAAVDFDIASKATLVGYGAQFWQIMILYGLAPLVYCASMIWFVVNKEKTTKDYLWFFIVLASFISSIRGLARHSLVETRYHFDFLILILIISPWFIQRFSEWKRQATVLGLALFCLLFTPIEGPIQASAMETSWTMESLGQERVTISPEAYPSDLIRLLKETLKSDQMFYENINAHLLYTLAQTKAPFLHHASQMVYNDSAQKVYLAQMDQLYQDGRLPLVVFSSDAWWGSYIDNIPNEFSTYRISEYVYTHYKPWIRLNGFDVWVANNSSLPNEYDLSSYGLYTQVDPRQSFGIGDLAYNWASYGLDTRPLKTLYTVNLNQTLDSYILDLPLDLDKSQGNYVLLTIEASQTSTATLSYLENQIQFTLHPGQHRYAIRISSQFVWMSESIPSLTLHVDKAKLLKLEISNVD